MKKVVDRWLLFTGGLAIAASIGLWSKSLFTISESIHFSVNFPAGENIRSGETMNCCDLGSPWERAFGSEWNNYPAGGVLVWGTEGQVLVDVGQEGWLKKFTQPHFLNLSSHWVRNVGVKPYKVHMQMDLCNFEMEWETPEADWNQKTHTTTRYIEPGKTFNMDWYIHIPPENFDQHIICTGKLTCMTPRPASRSQSYRSLS